MMARNASLIFLLLSFAGSSLSSDVAETEVTETEVCSDGSDMALTEDNSLAPFTPDFCANYADVVYKSDNRNPKPKWILEPIPSVPRVFLRRMRKAGSSTIEAFIQKARSIHQKALNTGALQEDDTWPFIGYDTMEYESLNIHCLHGPMAPLRHSNNAILVTHLRNPLTRFNSEYWWAGPGDKLKIATEETWRGWMAETKNRLGSSFGPGLYADNYYVRLLTGNCGDCHIRTVKKPHAKDIGMMQGCQTTTRYYGFPKVDEALYCKAIETANQFQVLVILEYYNKPAMNAYLQDTFEKLFRLAPGTLEKLTLGHSRKTIEDPNAILPEHRLAPPPGIIKELEEDNKYDLQLYDWAKNKLDTLLAPYE